MPRVPIYGDSAVADQGGTSARLQPSNYGPGIGAGVEALGKAGQDFVDKMDAVHAIYDQTNAKQLDVEHQKFVANQREQLNKVRGADAQPTAAKMATDLDEYNRDLLEQARSPRAKFALQQTIETRTIQHNEAADAYATGQFVEHTKAVNVARNDALTNDLLLATPGTPEFKQRAEALAGQIRSANDFLGDHSTETFDNQMRGAMDKVYGSQAQTIYSNKGAEAARSFLEDHRDEMYADTANRLLSAYAPEATNDRMRNTFLSSHGEPGGGTVSAPHESNAVLDGAGKIFPRLRPLLGNAVVIDGSSNDGRKLEFYSPSEPNSPAPGRLAVQVFDKSLKGRDLSESVALDLLHHLGSRDDQGNPVDPNYMRLKSAMVGAITAANRKMDRDAYEEERKAGLAEGSYEDWLQNNRADAYIRGYLSPRLNPEWQKPGTFTPEMKTAGAAIKDYLSAAPETVPSAPRNETMDNPAEGLRISSGFGHRSAPTAGASTNHGGWDIPMPVGSEVDSTLSGRVVFAGVKGGYGNTVIIDHGNGLKTQYSHLSSIEVKQGEAVDQGDEVAKSGSTGVSTGPHLHFQVWDHGAPADPSRYVGKDRKVASGGAGTVQAAAAPSSGGSLETDLGVADTKEQSGEWSPQEAKAWRSAANEWWGRKTAARSYNEDEAQRGAYTWLNSLPDPDKFTSLGQMPANVLAGLNPATRHGFQSMAESNAKGDTIEVTPQTMWLLGYKKASDPQGYASKEFFNSMVGKLPASQLRALAHDQGVTLGELQHPDPKHVTDSDLLSSAKDPLFAAGIDLDPSKTKAPAGSKAAQTAYEQSNQVMGALKIERDAWEAKHPGQKADETTKRQWVSNVMLNVAGTKHQVWNVTDDELVGQMSPGNKAAVIRTIQSRGGVADNHTIAETYRRARAQLNLDRRH